jgi:hypothetical protein
LGRECVPANRISGIGVAWRWHDWLPLRYHVPALVVDGERDPWTLTPFAMYWFRAKPTRGAVRRTERLGEFLGVPYLGELPGDDDPGVPPWKEQ